MLKKLLILLGLITLLNTPLEAQHIKLNYQSFRPFIHFQIDITGYNQGYNPYKSAYMYGYMNGVNDRYYWSPHFVDLARNIRAYKRGYEDGFRDRELLIRLRGYGWYNQHRFAYSDYYAPSYAVHIWLEGLSLSFLKAPELRLPRGWKQRAHPHLKRYWQSMKAYEHDKGYTSYYSTPNVERRFQKRIRGYRQTLDHAKKEHHRPLSIDRHAANRKTFGQNRSSTSSHKTRINRSHNQKKSTVRKQSRRRSHKKTNSHTSNKQRNHSRTRGYGNH